MTTPYLLQDLERDEGCKLFPYRDSRGIWTIGVGHNMEADPALFAQLATLQRTGITLSKAMDLLAMDVANVKGRLDADLPWWRQLSDVRQDVMVNLAFNLGEGKLATWHHTDGDIEAGNFKAAAIDLENDEPWASQVHARATRLALQMETDVRQAA
jgi:lysozyme